MEILDTSYDINNNTETILIVSTAFIIIDKCNQSNNKVWNIHLSWIVFD